MDLLRQFARNTNHVASYDSKMKCIFCAYSKCKHDRKMSQVQKSLEVLSSSVCTHECGGYVAHDKLWCNNCGASYACINGCNLRHNDNDGKFVCCNCGGTA